MLSEKMDEALNAQLNAELYSAYLYAAMAAYFRAANLAGFENWMRVQVREELFHATKFYDFINERGGRVRLAPLEGPPAEWDSPGAVFEHVRRHEQKVSALINELVDLAGEEKDHATNNFLQWFVAEQVEEEASVASVLQKLKLGGDASGALFMLDAELGARVFTPPPAAEA